MGSLDVQKKYLDALLEEMKLKKLGNYQFDSLYIGGGTPSSLPLNLLEKLFNDLSQYVDFLSLKEFSIELNPTDINLDLINLLVKFHVTRVSIGVETLVPRLQKIIKRTVFIDDLKNKLTLLINNHLDNINLDFLYALPSETYEEFCEDLSLMVTLPIKHLSVYSLILEEHTIFYHQYLKNELTLVSEKLETKMYHHLCSYLNKFGFHHYETSNFCLKGYESKHNLIYWNCDEYLGLGVSASSYFDHYRFTNTNIMKEYLEIVSTKEIKLLEKTFISKEEQMKEEIILGLRKTSGINQINFFNKYQIELKTKFPHINDLLKQKLLIEKNHYIMINKRYFYISNYIINKII